MLRRLAESDVALIATGVSMEGSTPWLRTVGALVGGVLIGSLLVTLLVMRRRWVTPVRSLASQAERLAAGEWQTRAHLETGSSDVRRLGEKLNRLAQQAQSQLESLRQQRANLQLLVDALPDPILLSDANERIVLVNAPAERLLQVPPQQLIGKKFASAVGDAVLLDLFDSVQKLSPEPSQDVRSPVHRELKLIRDSQRLSFQAIAERTETQGVLIVLRDVSTLAGAIQMKTDFVANASHELRTPISAIKVAFETLRDIFSEDPATAQRCIGIIEGHLKRLEEMLRDLLDLSRVESADLKPHFAPMRAVDLTGVLQGTWEPFASEKGVRLSITHSPGDLEFVSDRRLLDLLLKNLVENAIKFTPSGGTVDVLVERLGRDVQITVVDTGCGIPQEHLERVFERFYQVDNARSGGGRGTGLGLAIVKHAVHALGGTVRLVSQVGRGTTATCLLPESAPSEFSSNELTMSSR